MKMFVACVAMIMTLGLAASVQAGCTPEEVQKKSVEFSQAIQAKSQKDPQGYAVIMQELQPEILQLQQNPQDLDAACAFYDKALKKLK